MKKDSFIDIDKALRELKDAISKIEDIDANAVTDRVDALREELYEGVSRWGSVGIARHEDRPCCDDFIEELCDDFMELHGDRSYEDDPAVRAGLAVIDGRPVVLIAHRKRSCGKKDYLNFHYGMASPSGHYKAIRMMKLAEKFGRPVVTLVDTPGAYPAPEAEYKGQAQSIARCIATLADLKTPVMACILGEAGSGGALALGFGDRVVMLENAFYSAISPEGYASIVYKDASRKEEAADALKGTAKDLLDAGIVDHLVREPVGGAHNDPERVIRETAVTIKDCLKEICAEPLDELLARRRQRMEDFC